MVQTSATLITPPQYPIATPQGTTKIPSLFGTSIAAFQYASKLNIRWKLLMLMCSIALAAAYAGSVTVAMVSNNFMKPAFFIILTVVFIYTCTKKDFGLAIGKSVTEKKKIPGALSWHCSWVFMMALLDPAPDVFLILFFIGILGFDFLIASAHAKLVNVATNIGSIIFFSRSGRILYHYPCPWLSVILQVLSLGGSTLAILKGNRFIRVFFLLVITATIIRFGYDIFVKK